MIELSIQLKLIIFSFIFGFFLCSLIGKYNELVSNKAFIIKAIYAFILMTVLDVIYFFGIYIISNAIFHIYSLISIIVGMITYALIIKKIT